MIVPYVKVVSYKANSISVACAYTAYDCFASVALLGVWGLETYILLLQTGVTVSLCVGATVLSLTHKHNITPAYRKARAGE